VRPDLDPDSLSPEERQLEVTAILARGVMRLKQRHALTSHETSFTQKFAESPSPGLAVHPNTCVTVHTG
jgi:hypothetical protein